MTLIRLTSDDLTRLRNGEILKRVGGPTILFTLNQKKTATSPAPRTFTDWLSHHGCTVHELWLMQNMLGSCLGWETDLYLAAKGAWEKKRHETKEASASKWIIAKTLSYQGYIDNPTQAFLAAILEYLDKFPPPHQ